MLVFRWPVQPRRNRGMRDPVRLLVTVGVLFIGFGSGASLQDTLDPRADVEAAVYGAVVRDRRLNGREFTGTQVVLQAETVDPRREWWWDTGSGTQPFDIRGRLPEADVSLVEDFARQNRTTADLGWLARRDSTLTLLSAAEFEKFFVGKDAGGWDRFYAAYPKATGIVWLSRVGLNTGGSQAILYVGRQSHYLAGAGYFILLRKSDKGWQIVRAELIWES